MKSNCDYLEQNQARELLSIDQWLLYVIIIIIMNDQKNVHTRDGAIFRLWIESYQVQIAKSHFDLTLSAWRLFARRNHTYLR